MYCPCAGECQLPDPRRALEDLRGSFYPRMAVRGELDFPATFVRRVRKATVSKAVAGIGKRVRTVDPMYPNGYET